MHTASVASVATPLVIPPFYPATGGTLTPSAVSPRFPLLADRRPGFGGRPVRRLLAESSVRVLVVGDDLATVESLKARLGAEGHEVLVSARTEGISAMLAQAQVECLLADVRMPGAAALLEAVRGTVPSVRAELFAEEAGMVRLLPSPDLAAPPALEAGGATGLAAAPAAGEAEPNGEGPFHGMHGSTPAMRAVFRMIRRAARTDVTVLVTGESGTGKELVARALHEESRRRGKPFVALNCSALPSELVESELFGHTKGAFTGAIKDRGGLFEAANGGTLFLDEIGDLGPLAQAKVLRALENGEVMRVGGTKSTQVDVRVIAATHRPLEQMVADGRFREDLLYRLKVITVALPPLRERRDDLPLLAGHFLRLFADRYGRPVQVLDPEALAQLLRHDWPGNVRELRNVIEGALVMADGTEVTAADLPATVRSGGARAGGGLAMTAVGRAGVVERVVERAADRRADREVESLMERAVPVRHEGIADGVMAVLAQTDVPFVEARERALREFDRAFLAAALERHGGNIARTARALGLHRQSLQKLLARRELRQDQRPESRTDARLDYRPEGRGDYPGDLQPGLHPEAEAAVG